MPLALPDTPTFARLDARLRGPGSAAIVEADELEAMARESGLDAHAIVLACLGWAQRWARAPVSNFEVGAAALGGSGRLYLGANIEFRGQPLAQTIHAEQAVIAHAWAHAEARIELLATSAAPCGYCRQFLLELPEPRPRLLLADHSPALTSLDALLPEAFGPTQLGRAPQLLRAGPHGLRLASSSAASELERAALAAADRGSAPYTGALSGVAVQASDGSIHAGAIAESVAYNPTLAPMQAALIAAHHGGAHVETIMHAVLVEIDGAQISQLDHAAAILASVAAGATLRRTLALAPSTGERGERGE